MSPVIHIVEPTLENEAGHCHSFVASLFRAGSGQKFCLWGGRRGELPPSFDDVDVRRHFSRRLRRPQAFLLYRRLLRQPGRIFISTSGRTDLLLLDWAAGGKIPPRKVYLFFHWLRLTENKRRSLSRLAERQPETVLLGPTPSVVEALRACGFSHVHLVPYPISPPALLPTDKACGFDHLLFAGAARADKGIAQVVDFLEFLTARGESLPFVVQTSADHFQKFDAPARMALGRLARSDYPHVRLEPGTLSPERYRALYDGAILLQLYDRQAFTDRISGITLDALTNGAPIVTLAGTWMGRVVERFGAGAVLDDSEPETLLQAVETIRAEYTSFRRNALRGGEALQSENSASHLLRVLTA